MRKEIYLLQGSGNETYRQFSDRILSIGKAVSVMSDVSSVKVTLTNAPPPFISIIPFKKKKIASLSVFHENPTTIESLTSAIGFIGAYAAEEAIPVAYNKTWNDMEPTPGICLLTLFRKRKDISFDSFLDRWHNSHTPLSLKIHPLWYYNRNVSRIKLTEDTADWDGIVEEQFKTKSDLLNPVRFFGHPLIMPYRMWQVYTDTKSFLDYKTIEPYFATEIHIKS